MKTRCLLFVLSLVGIASATGCRVRHTTFAMWPFRQNSSETDFRESMAAHNGGDPFLLEGLGNRSSAQPLQTVSVNAQFGISRVDSRPVITQVSHEPAGPFEDFQPRESAVDAQRWQRRKQRTSAKFE